MNYDTGKSLNWVTGGCRAIAPSEGQQQPPVPSEQVVEHIPTAELGQFFQEELAFCSETALEQIVQFTHQVIHKAVLHPRHTWSVRSNEVLGCFCYGEDGVSGDWAGSSKSARDTFTRARTPVQSRCDK